MNTVNTLLLAGECLCFKFDCYSTKEFRTISPMHK